MHLLAFSSAEITFYILYFIFMIGLLVAWIMLWKRDKEREKTRLLPYMFINRHPIVSVCNWFIAVVFVFNIIRLILTFVYGMA